MKVTFLIGNGFDLGLGMKSKFIDVLNSYVAEEGNNLPKAKLKSLLAQNNGKEIEKWSDFEMELARNANLFDNEDELINSIRDFKRFMVEYLENEEHRVVASIMEQKAKLHAFAEKMAQGLGRFYFGLTPNERKQLFLDGPQEYRTINFNYTELFDILLSHARKEKILDNSVFDLPIHIHGTLRKDVIMGVDTEEQFVLSKFLVTRRLRRAFVKQKILSEFDDSRISMALSAIKNSDIVVAYGFSMGESDKTWVDAIKEWLKTHEDNHFIFFYYDEENHPYYNIDRILEIADERKEEIFQKMHLTKEEIVILERQIHVPVGYEANIFDFSNVEYIVYTNVSKGALHM